MSYQYYAMDFGEILWLLVVLSLWVLSIICCIKRYEKISTIERAEMISRDKLVNNKNDVPQSSSANVNLTSSVNVSKVNSTSNLIGAGTPNSMMKQSSQFDVGNITSNTNVISTHTTSSNKTNKPKDLNSNCIPNTSTSRGLYNDSKFTKPHSNNLKNVIVIDETYNNSNNMNNVIRNPKYRYEIVSYTKSNHHHQLPHQHAKHNRNLINNNQHQQHNKLKHNKITPSNQAVVINPNKQNNCYLIRNNFSISNTNKLLDNQKPLIKSSSEPALHEDFMLLNIQSTNASVNVEKHARASSIDVASNRLLIKSTSNYSEHFCGANRMADAANLSVKRIPRIPAQQDSNYLIDPNRIPKIIRKSLLDLHKKSVLNLSQHNSSNNITNNNNRSNVFTQQRHKNEIKMNINKN